MLDNIYLVAGGKNSRFGGLSFWPKLLMPVDNKQSILMHDIDMLKRCCKQMTVIINAQYYDQLKEYVANLSLPVKIVKSTNTNGSANTIREALSKEDVAGKNGLFVWSDLIIDESLQDTVSKIENDNAEAAYVLFSLDYRLGIDKDNRLSTNAHNLPGIYYISDLATLQEPYQEYEDYDLASFIADKYAGKYKCYWYSGKLLEYRDKQSFLDYYLSETDKASNMQTRFFNQITVNPKDKTLIKKCVDTSYDKLIEHEVSWYKEVGDEPFVPKLYSYDIETPYHFMKMEHLRDTHPFSYDLANKNTAAVSNLLKVVDKLHSHVKDVDPKTYEEDCRMEYYDKPVNRMEKVWSLLDDHYKETFLLVDTAYGYIMSHVDHSKYCLIHGDLNGSNVLIDNKTNDAKLIDSRGYFGKTQNYGPKEYDYAKILYAATGYDSLNKCRAVCKGDDELTNWPKSDWYRTISDVSWLPKELNTSLLWVIVGTIYLSLTSYIGQDIFKANIAYKRGISILRAFL